MHDRKCRGSDGRSSIISDFTNHITHYRFPFILTFGSLTTTLLLFRRADHFGVAPLVCSARLNTSPSSLPRVFIRVISVTLTFPSSPKGFNFNISHLSTPPQRGSRLKIRYYPGFKNLPDLSKLSEHVRSPRRASPTRRELYARDIL